MRTFRFVRSIPILRAKWHWTALVSGLAMIAYLSSSAEVAPVDSPNSPLKKAPLTEFHAAAKHIAAKAIGSGAVSLIKSRIA